MVRRLLCLTAAAAAIAVPAASAASGAAPPPARPGDPAALREAVRLSAEWGRCATARPAHRALDRARHARGSARAPAARRARAAWRRVAAECAAPVPMPVADPSARGQAVADSQAVTASRTPLP